MKPVFTWKNQVIASSQMSLGNPDRPKKIGIGAGAGALVGGLLGGKKGAGLGTVVGGGAGTTMVLTGGGDEVELGVGHKVNVRLQDPIVVLVPRS